ncbi:MAG: CopG family transcriptional regulator [Hormoscilla sp. SP5CHS1]|nr:CopG family transcriptional regulator [Hormoscilla sp. SP12CHS1]MBC6456297.1 CopG family transcriptional regulator [Hormoscilla sp. SP5CHS1]
MKAEELDKKFDNGEDVLEFFDLSTLRLPGLETKPVKVDFPQWMVDALDKESKRLGIQQQVLIKDWIAEPLNAS